MLQIMGRAWPCRIDQCVMVGPDMQEYLSEGPILARGRRVVWLRTHLFCLGRKWSRLSEADHVDNGLPKPAKTATPCGRKFRAWETGIPWN